jgi:hypothetical protein
MADKSEVMIMSPRTGRPTDNPKQDRITVRLDNEANQILRLYCEQKLVDKAEAIRRGIKKLAGEIEK